MEEVIEPMGGEEWQRDKLNNICILAGSSKEGKASRGGEEKGEKGGREMIKGVMNLSLVVYSTEETRTHSRRYGSQDG